MRVTAAVVGAGQAGLAMSRHLAAAGLDHVVLERDEVAASWRRERWDSLRLLTPNWMCRLPGYPYVGPDADGYQTAAETAGWLEVYARHTGAPVRRRLRSAGAPEGRPLRGRDRRRLLPRRGRLVAAGASSDPRIPAVAAELPRTSTRSPPCNTETPPRWYATGDVLVVGVCQPPGCRSWRRFGAWICRHPRGR